LTRGTNNKATLLFSFLFVVGYLPPRSIMSPTTATDPSSKPHPSETDAAPNSAEGATANHDLPARSGAEDEEGHQREADDAATMAASEELRHTSISDRINPASRREDAEGRSGLHQGDKAMGEHVRSQTPEHDELKERLSSPKKKRGRDFEDEGRDVAESEVGEKGSSVTAGSAVNTSRTSRSEPEKKRPRDTSEETTASTREAMAAKVSLCNYNVQNSGGSLQYTLQETSTTSSLDPKTTSGDSNPSKDSSKAVMPVFGSAFADKQETSSSAFLSSGFGALSSSTTSPFGSIGASKPSVFGGGSQASSSGFGALAGTKQSNTGSEPTSALGAGAGKPSSGFAFGSGATTSGFAALGGGSAFSSALGNGFAGGSGPKLSSFAAPPGKGDVAPGKPAKAFGAPDSDEDDDGDEDESEGGAEGEEDDSTKAGSEDKKKSKSGRGKLCALAIKHIQLTGPVYVEDGESGEATLLQMRVKLFALDSKEKGWKERGVGTLKINVPEACVSFDDNGVPIPGSFDISGLEDDGEESTTPRVPRLIMRQENTHRVILNTILVRAMDFKDKPSTTGAQILFTAFEGEKEPKPINMLLKVSCLLEIIAETNFCQMSEANSKLFRSEIDSIQHEL
jgi:hypothetical protein